MPEVKNLLDDVFKKPEPEVRYFSEVMRTPVTPVPKKTARHKPGDVKGMPETESIKVVALTKQQSGQVVIEHGWVDQDYVWHIEPSARRQWKVTIDRLIYAVAKTMHNVIPDTVRVNIFKPFLDWEVKVVTFKAHNLGDCWNVSKKDVNDLTLKLFEILNPLI